MVQDSHYALPLQMEGGVRHRARHKERARRSLNYPPSRSEVLALDPAGSTWPEERMRRMASVCFALIVAGLIGLPAAAQGVFGTITGTLVDSSGGVLPGATVVVTNVHTNVTKSLTTNEAGVYSAT